MKKTTIFKNGTKQKTKTLSFSTVIYYHIIYIFSSVL